MGKLYRIGRFYGSHGNGADSKNLERMDKKIDDVKENFENLMEGVRDIKKTIEFAAKQCPLFRSRGGA